MEGKSWRGHKRTLQTCGHRDTSIVDRSGLAHQQASPPECVPHPLSQAPPLRPRLLNSGGDAPYWAAVASDIHAVQVQQRFMDGAVTGGEGPADGVAEPVVGLQAGAAQGGLWGSPWGNEPGQRRGPRLPKPVVLGRTSGFTCSSRSALRVVVAAGSLKHGSCADTTASEEMSTCTCRHRKLMTRR